MSARDDQRGETAEVEKSEASDEASPKTWTAWGGGPGWRLPFSGRESGDRVGRGATDAAGRRWTEGYTMLIVVGALLVVFPEPATSVVGLVLLVAGVLGWLAETLR